MGKDLNARKKMGKVLSFLPTGEYYFTKGLRAYNRRDFIKAKKYLQRAMQLEPGEPMITYQLAIIQAELGEYEHSNRLLHLILEELDEEMAECHYFLANNYAHMGFFKDAYEHAKLYLQLDQDGEFTEDTEDLLEVLTVESEEMDEDLYEQDDLMVKQERARELLESGYFPKAIELLNEVIKEYPEYWSAYNNLALAYFYLGESKKAESILMDVLEQSPGNLHALCNLLVLAHYLKQMEKETRLIETLRRIQPMFSEHQFKLGATFALVGEYELAYGLLKKLYKYGFNGDGQFYYWLSYSAYFTGRETFARNIWKKVLELNRDKEGSEPWNKELEYQTGFENHPTTIYLKLESGYAEERLFALFLISVSAKKEEMLSSNHLSKNEKLTALEWQYVSYLTKEQSSPIVSAHKIAKQLYEFYQPIGTVESGLYLLWFTIFGEISSQLNNHRAWAAAVDYVWNKLRGQKMTQQEVADRYGISSATVAKYVKMVNNYLNVSRSIDD